MAVKIYSMCNFKTRPFLYLHECFVKSYLLVRLLATGEKVVQEINLLAKIHGQ